MGNIGVAAEMVGALEEAEQGHNPLGKVLDRDKPYDELQQGDIPWNVGQRGTLGDTGLGNRLLDSLFQKVEPVDILPDSGFVHFQQ